ncbi:MAG: MBL fold metallo-hydrolase, partial [Desulfobacterales bacterium]|nr:MBL fold metallo-hydrolase [Desulfobacterales bacterium]
MKQNPSVSLKTVDRVEVTTLMDNYVDLLLPSTDLVLRPPLAKQGQINPDTLLAEHGLSLLVTVFQGDDKHTVLFDTGYTKVGVLYNMTQLGINPEEIEAIVLSHGHMDHTGSLNGVLDKIPHKV